MVWGVLCLFEADVHGKAIKHSVFEALKTLLFRDVVISSAVKGSH